MPRIFVSQRNIQRWAEEGRVHIDGSLLTFLEWNRQFRLIESFFVERVVSPDGYDVMNLTGRVKTRLQLAQLGSDVFMTSLVVGDAAYEGQPGFVCEPLAQGVKSSRLDAVPTRAFNNAPTGKIGAR